MGVTSVELTLRGRPFRGVVDKGDPASIASRVVSVGRLPVDEARGVAREREREGDKSNGNGYILSILLESFPDRTPLVSAVAC